MTQTAQCTAARAAMPAPVAAMQAEAAAFIKNDDVPRRLECPITRGAMHDPVSLDGYGQVFERSALAQAFARGAPYKNPASNEVIPGIPRCTPRLDLREDYDSFRAAVLALDPAKARELPDGPRKPAGPLVSGLGVDVYSDGYSDGYSTRTMSAGGRTGMPNRWEAAIAARQARGRQEPRRVERTLTPMEAGAVVGCAAGTCCAASAAMVVLTPILCAAAIVVCPVNAALQCCGLPPIPCGTRCCNDGPPVLD